MKRFFFWLLLVLDRLSLWIENMSNSYYTPTGNPASATLGRAANIRSEFEAIEDGFDEVEALLSHGGAAVASNTAVGTSALAVNTSGGTENTAVGTSALAANTTADGQVAVGFEALLTSVNGGKNVAVGWKAMNSGTAAAFNVAIGPQAMYTVGLASLNVAVGREALKVVGDGARNVAVGNLALLAFTGIDTIAIGSSAQQSNVSALGNVSCGGSTLLANTGGDYNCAFGLSAMVANTTGDRNSAFGYLSLWSNTTGSDNTAIGTGALYSNLGGAQNTAIGKEAGFGSGSNANTSGNNNTWIGYQAEGTSSTVSNEFTLGNGSVATLRCQVTSITSLSDARDKTAISDLSFGLDFIASLRPVAFTWNTRDGAKVGIRSSGFIAQELKAAQESWGASEVLRLVYEENPEKLEASYGHLIPVLVKALQELNAEVDSLRAQLIG